MMGKIFTITPKIRQIAQDAIDDLIDQLGKECRLLYPAVTIDCPNCIFDPTTNRSSGRYKTGGPRPFPANTICPICRGAGRLPSENSEIVRMLCTWNPKEFTILPGNIQIPNSYVQTKGYMRDVPKILRSKKMVIQLPIEGNIRATFDLVGNPVDPGNIIQGRYFVALWRQSPGTQ
jgi:hypothetical protein